MASEGDVMAGDNQSRSGTLFLRALFLGAAAVLAGGFLVVALKSLPGKAAPATANVLSGSQGGADVAAPSVPAGPYAKHVLSMYSGPSEDYDVLGSVSRNAELEVVGRSDDNQWIAVSVTPHSALYGWLRVTDVANLPALSTLPVKPAFTIR